MKWLFVLMFALGACGSSQVRSILRSDYRASDDRPLLFEVQNMEEGSPEKIAQLEAAAELLVLKRDMAQTQMEVLRTQRELRQVKADFLQLQQKINSPKRIKKKGSPALKFAWNP